ncbi:MAG: cytochrome c oxidase subunit 4 [Chloroflexota bacterium]|nr:cytochrome c oxidase subunit 4 [Chloroflexota bacterium]
MAEELRFFLRPAAYSAVIGIAYWFASYEVAGSVMLAFVVFATGLIVGIFFFAVRATRGELDPHSRGPILRAGMAIARVVGFTEPQGTADEQPIAAGLEPLPPASSWPLVAGGAATMLGLGLVYGPWLSLPGIVVAGFAIWGWLTQMDAPR